jgi:hypothetical protein
VLLWYVGLAILGVAVVFRSSGIDYRYVAVGSMLPLSVDLAFGHRAYGHTLLFGVGLLAAVMIGTIRRPRLLRRRLLCLPIGAFAGLVLSGAFTADHLFWWPLLGSTYAHDALLPAWWVVVLEELVGLVACWILVGRYDLYLAGPRQEFLRTGRLV